MNRALIIFVRNPEKGKVKTRLAALIGADAALHVYKKLLLHTKAISKPVAADKFVFYTDSITADDIWNEEGYQKRVQADGDLGAKMKAAFSLVFSSGYKEVIIIGSDCPSLTSDDIEEAFIHLKSFDVVIGPAQDGGYYLLGMNCLHPALFEHITWSTAAVFEETIHIIKKGSLQCKALSILTDIDEAKDLPQSWQEEINNLSHLA